MKQSYEQFSSKIASSTFEGINKKVITPIHKRVKTESYKQQQPLKNQTWKKTVYIKNKQPYENRQNLYLKVIDLMKMFIRFEQKDFLAYAYRQSNFQNVLNKLQNYRLHSPQIQLLFYLVKNNSRKQIALYVKLRQQIITRCGHNQTKYKQISIHNQNKNFISQNVQVGSIKIDYLYWGILADMTKSNISEDMIWWLSQGNRKVSAVEFIKACLWTHQYSIDNPQFQ